MDRIDALESDRRSAKLRYEAAWAVADARAMAEAADEIRRLDKLITEELSGRKQAA